jgi:hypothetical protein
MKEVPGGSKPLRKWEYYYWGLGATGMAFFLYTRLKKPEKTPEEIQVSCGIDTQLAQGPCALHR